MPKKSESFVHYHVPRAVKVWALGFTARIVPTDRRNDRGDLLCDFAVTFCNPKDKHWNKAIGRSEVCMKPITEVRVRDLPRLLQDAHNQCWDGPNVIDAVRHSQYDYVLRRFV